MGADGIVLEVMPDYAFFNPEDTFRFASHNGVNYVELYKQIDRDGPTAALDDDTNVFSFTLKCSLQSNMSDYVLYDAKIFVLDVNDNDPEFGNLTDTLTINELTPVDMSVLPVRATDKDLNVNLTYSVLPRSDLSGEPIAVFPVPNKVKANVPIKARDLDAANNPVSFSIASSRGTFG
nr:hypothetical protein BaRGS_027363 [Batillaria attramentaria]